MSSVSVVARASVALLLSLMASTARAQYRLPLQDGTWSHTAYFAHTVPKSGAPGGVEVQDYRGQCTTYCRYDCVKTADGKTSQELLACSEWSSAKYQTCVKGNYCHLGTDFAVPFGRKVVAASNGTVTKVSNTCDDKPANKEKGCTAGETCKCAVSSCGGKMGNYLQLKDGFGRVQTYMHLVLDSIPSEILSGTKKEVVAGEVLGEVGCTGYTTGTHLHFEVLEDGSAVDAYAVVKNSSLWMGPNNKPENTSFEAECGSSLVPGAFADGLHLPGSGKTPVATRGFQRAYGLRYLKSVLAGPTSSQPVSLGCPTSVVHNVHGVWLQDFRQKNSTVSFSLK